ncbi:MAG TPA: hypothetical protein VMT87_10365 [Vicinamibacteria bacterium]|nr:hypothetical protein [Vicinamibacteria bacterium]
MTKRQGWMAGAALILATAAADASRAAGPAATPEDDLAVVKKAVMAQNTAPAAEEAPPGERTATRGAAARPVRPGKEPTWLKVRVTEKGTSRKKVTVNLPLALVRALDGAWPPIDFSCGEGRRARCEVDVAEVLAALEAGQELVEIDDEDSLVKVWVE